jgi:MFS family permease
MSAPLRRPAFRRFFTARLLSLLGSAMAPVALAFAVLDASRRPGDLGVVMACRLLPGLALMLLGGAVADRFSRRGILVLTSLGGALTQATVAAVLLTGHYRLAVVAAVEVVSGILDAFTYPALRGVVPDLVDAGALQRANALLGSVRNATKIIGPAAAGLVVTGAGGGWAIAVDAATYLVAAALLVGLPLARGAGMPGRRTRLLADIRGGARAFRRLRWLWPVSLAFAVVNLVNLGPWQVLGPTLTAGRGGAAVWGAVLSARGVGMLAASAVMYRVVSRHLLRLGLLWSLPIALPLLLLGLAAAPEWLVAGAFLAGLGSAVEGVSWETTLQEHVPGGLLSRVSSFDDLLSFVAIPLSVLAAGPLAAAYGARRVCLAASAVFGAAVLAPLLLPAVRTLPHRTADPDASPRTAPVG